MVLWASPHGVFSSKNFAVMTKGTRGIGRTAARCRGDANLMQCRQRASASKGSCLHCANGKTHKITRKLLEVTALSSFPASALQYIMGSVISQPQGRPPAKLG